MALSLPDKWIWDFWLTEHDGVFHLFFLQAPKSIGDPHLRHWNVSIGHAASTDLTCWSLRPDALGPATSLAWDDCSTWTGSIVRHDGRWHLFYTGTSHAEQGSVQRIGRATSFDLDHWERESEPLIASDPRWYEQIGSHWHDEAWRDPWVFRGDDGVFHALITARANDGARFERGCIAHATSDDLHGWEVQPPITTPGGFGELEVPQAYEIDGTWYLIFCSHSDTQSDARRETGPGTGTYYMVADRPLGPFDAAEARPLQADRTGTSYAGRLVDFNGTQLLTWLNRGASDEFVGELSDPVPVRRRGPAMGLEVVGT